jgi:hypothetical protein
MNIHNPRKTQRKKKEEKRKTTKNKRTKQETNAPKCPIRICALGYVLVWSHNHDSTCLITTTVNDSTSHEEIILGSSSEPTRRDYCTDSDWSCVHHISHELGKPGKSKHLTKAGGVNNIGCPEHKIYTPETRKCMKNNLGPPM